MNKKADYILFYITIFLLLIALCATYNLPDNDLFSRLIMGKSVVLTGAPMFHDVISYTKTNIWIDHEWLLSGFIYIIATLFHVTGLTILKALFLFLWIVFLVVAVKEYNKNKEENPRNLFLYLALILSLVLSQILYATVRCQLFTFMAMPLFIFLLEKIRNDEKNKIKYCIFAVLLMLLWLNCHAGALAALGIVLLYAIGSIFNRKPFKIYLILFIFCALCFFINPWGYDYIRFLIDTCSVDRSYIGEWQSPFGPLVINLDIFKITFIGVVLAYIYKTIKIVSGLIKKDLKEIKELDFVKVLVLGAVLILSAKYIKHIYLFMTISLIYLYGDFYILYNNVTGKIKTFLKKHLKFCDNIPQWNFDIFKKSLLYTAIAVYSIIILIQHPIQKTILNNFSENYPVNALNFIQINDIEGNVLAPYYVSGYIAYKGYPKLKIFMDGRQEQLYPQEYIFMNMNFYALQGPYPFIILEKFRPDIIIIEDNWPILQQEKTLNHLGFRKVYQDERYGIFLDRNKLKFSYFPPQELNNKYFGDIFKTKILE